VRPDVVRGDVARGRRLTRREALAAGGTAALAALLGGCGGTPVPGSTLRGVLRDPDGDGLLARAAGEPLQDRTELGGGGAPGRVLAEFAQLTDAHVRDAQSPARVPFLDRFGTSFGSSFRPHETLTGHVLAAAADAIRDAGPGPVFVTGDLVDNAQANELAWARAILTGARGIRLDSGAPGYAGVQQRSGPDPAYYRPDVDAPRHPGLLARAVAPLDSGGLGVRWYPTAGNHDVLVQGELAVTPAIRRAAVGTRLLRSLDERAARGLAGARLTSGQIDALVAAGLPGDALRVAPDPERAPLEPAVAVRRLAASSAARPADPDRLDLTVPLGDDVVAIVLDLARRDRGAEGLVTGETVAALRRGLDAAGDRWVVVLTHQPLAESEGAAAALALLDADPRVVATIAGHRHRHRVDARRTPAGGFWQVQTGSLVDTPQQWRALRLVETARGIALETWVADHAGVSNDEASLAGIARDLAWLDAQGGRPARAMGRRADRNVRLHLPRRPRRPPARRPAPEAPVAPAPDGPGLGDGFG
jgi:GNAT superfamily N-acetyltransferase